MFKNTGSLFMFLRHQVCPTGVAGVYGDEDGISRGEPGASAQRAT